ncbi:citrate lyase holo-[acyl-carrier protein] synthase [Vagococcus acidifermentans]|uniref:citrate lyase holo-[acyl-carrier protein] synthase n=1 Tax=Vagococcus acidifermentans TaxID=564710 RepID=A0A430B317_9ENTE|nr:citrate lyase holo-[acyl-carrier protein] synthase [Vagococcus acidifermentans]RSU14736.1 citrate lyase holo-[acyl-carrier protein] synthase [Vagococcus acidifermentans]
MSDKNAVTLDDMLAAREQRAAIQRQLLQETVHVSLLSATMNIPGPVKNSQKLTDSFLTVIDAVEDQLAEHNIICQFSRHERTGPEYYLVLQLPPEMLKKQMVAIEETHPLGRLMDLDVWWFDGEIKQMSRVDIGFPARRCLICSRDAKECSRSRRHSVAELQDKITEIIVGREQHSG